MAHTEQTIEAYRASVGQGLAISPWFRIDQSRINSFAEITEDRQAIHVAPEAVDSLPFGQTIAHGFLTLSFLSAMANSALAPIAGATAAINYGINNLRFLAPVRAGSRVRGCFNLREVRERNPGQWQSVFDVTVEIENGAKPALVAQWLTLTILA
jgi:acyl dehydratase